MDRNTVATIPALCHGRMLSRRAAAALLAVAILHSYTAGPLQAEAARIIVYPLPWTSHSFAMAKLGAELNRRGHDVSFVVAEAFADKVTALLDRFRSINPAGAGASGGGVRLVTFENDVDHLMKLAHVNPIQLIKQYTEDLNDHCRALVRNETAMAALRHPPADLFVGDATNQCCWILSDLLRLPRVDYLVGGGGALVESMVYRTSAPLAYVPMYGSGQNPAGMSLMGRTANALTYAITKSIQHFITDPGFKRVSRNVNRTWPPGPASQAAAARRTVLAISGTDFAVEPPRPAQPHIKYVGPLLPEPPLPLPPHLDAIMAGADERGVVVAAFGSLLSATPETMLTIARALAALQQTVIWKMVPSDIAVELKEEFEGVLEGSKDLHIVPWVPSLNDLLGHPATKAFLNHGGLHSFYEAIYHGVPMVVMPIGADQPDNARVLTDYHRVALTVKPSELSRAAEDGAAKLTAALRRVMTDSGFRERVAKLSRRLRGHRRTPVEQAGDWVDYALTQDGEPFLQTPEADMTFAQLHLYDVVALAAATIAAAIAGPALVLRWCLGRHGGRHLPVVARGLSRTQKRD